MKIKKINNEVLYSKERITRVNLRDITYLKKLASKNKTRKIRLCTHRNTKDNLHEMLIVHNKNYYVWPHKHLNSTESFNIIDGKLDIVFFSNTGKIIDWLPMGAFHTGRNFYYRLPKSHYHTVVIRSKVAVFHEITKGPFLKKKTILAPWAPDRNNKSAVKKYLKKLKLELNGFIKNKCNILHASI